MALLFLQSADHAKGKVIRMSSARDLFDRSKLTLHRLNNLWSPTGKTFCYSADHWLRQSVWNDDDPDASITQLHYALIHLMRAYKMWNETGTIDTKNTEWNLILSGAMNNLDMLRPMLKRSSNAAVQNIMQNI